MVSGLSPDTKLGYVYYVLLARSDDGRLYSSLVSPLHTEPVGFQATDRRLPEDDQLSFPFERLVSVVVVVESPLSTELELHVLQDSDLHVYLLWGSSVT